MIADRVRRPQAITADCGGQRQYLVNNVIYTWAKIRFDYMNIWYVCNKVTSIWTIYMIFKKNSFKNILGFAGPMQRRDIGS